MTAFRRPASRICARRSTFARRRARPSRARHLGAAAVVIAALVGGYAAFNAPSASTAPNAVPPAPDGADFEASRIALIDSPAAPAPIAPRRWITAEVRRNDTLSRIFARHGIDIADSYSVARLEAAKPLLRIRRGQRIELAADEDGALAVLRYPLDRLNTLRVLRSGDAMIADVITRRPEVRLRRGNAVIRHSLLAAAADIGMDFAAARQMAHIFGWQVDFNRELRSGDRFSVIFEEQHLDGEKIGNGDIIAAELIVSARRLRAIRHLDAAGRAAYYAPDGSGIESSFLRSPLEFPRVTSRFSRKRFHPVLKQWRPHRGVDYGAPRGTPVRATGDGVVAYAGRDGDYGNAVRIRHGAQYTTLYAHLHGFAAGIKAGARVRQGDVIGSVGNTGLSTAPHLHYEFRIDGVHRNPLTVDLPRSAPIAPAQRAAFLRRADALAAELDRLGASELARLEPAPSSPTQ